MANIVLRLFNTSYQGTTVSSAGSLTLPTLKLDASNLAEYEKYDYHQNFMQPADAWTIHIGAEKVSDELDSTLKNNAQVYINIETDEGDSRVIGAGYIDQIKLHNYREGKGGSFYEIRGRTAIAQAIDDGIDPWSKTFDFAEGTSLGTMMARIFSQYGMDTIWAGTDASVRDIVTGVNPNNPNNRVQTTTITIPTLAEEAYVEGFSAVEPSASEKSITQTITQIIDPSQPVDIVQFKTKKLKPEPHETAYSFAETHAKRFHLHIWGVPDGSGVVIGKPDYDQPATYKFVNTYDGNGNNVHDSWRETDSINMPTAIIAKGTTGGGDFATTTVKCAKVNEFLGYLPGAYAALNGGTKANQTYNSKYIKPSVLTRINRFKSLPIVDPNTSLLQNQDMYQWFNPNDVKTSVVYWQDKTSKTLAELESAIQRRMSDFMRNALRIHIKVDGHDQDGAIYRYNTIALVNDEKLKINAPMWIEDVMFRKSRTEGTVTELVLVPLYILYF